MAINPEFEPDKILAEFLRAYVPEIERVDYSDRQVSRTETFSGDNTTTTFTLNYIPIAIEEIQISSVKQKKYACWSYSLRDKTISFQTAPSGGTDNISVDYFGGKTWIFPDRPRKDLTTKSYPRVSVEQIDEDQEPMGIFDNDTWDTLTFQIDVYTKKDLRVNFSGKQYADQDAADIIARQIQQAIRDNWRDELCGVLFYPKKLTATSLPYERDKGLYRYSMRYRFKAINAGEYVGFT